MTPFCSVSDCGSPVKARGLCGKHYWRVSKNGSPDIVRKPHGQALEFLASVVLPFTGDECLVWPFFRNKEGYGQVNKRGAHVEVCERAHGPRPSNIHEAAHSCGNGHLGCVNPKHLRWATPMENAADRIKMGTTLKGERNPMAKLSDAETKAILAQKGRTTQAALASAYGVNPSTISLIHSGKRRRATAVAEVHQ